MKPRLSIAQAGRDRELQKDFEKNRILTNTERKKMTGLVRLLGISEEAREEVGILLKQAISYDKAAQRCLEKGQSCSEVIRQRNAEIDKILEIPEIQKKMKGMNITSR